MGVNKETLELAKMIETQKPTDPESGEEIEGFLSKFIVLAEWMDVDGNKYLVRKSGNGMGESVPSWDFKGLLLEGILGRFD